MPLDRGAAYLAACTIYRNDAAYLAEWIEFHRQMGFEGSFLSNERSLVRYGSAVREALARRG